MNLRRVDAEDCMQCRPRIEGGRIGRLVPMASPRQPGRGFGCSVSKTLQDNLDPQIALRDLGVIGVGDFQRLTESKDVFLHASGGDFLFRSMTTLMTMGRQDGRISVTRGNGVNDPMPVHP